MIHAFFVNDYFMLRDWGIENKKVQEIINQDFLMLCFVCGYREKVNIVNYVLSKWSMNSTNGWWIFIELFWEDFEDSVIYWCVVAPFFIFQISRILKNFPDYSRSNHSKEFSQKKSISKPPKSNRIASRKIIYFNIFEH